MRKNVLAFLCLLVLALPIYAADGVTQDIDKICSFRFPAQAHITEVPGMKNYLYQTDSCSYLVQVKPFTQSGVIEDTISLNSFYGGIVKGILRGFHATLIGSKHILIDHMHGEEAEYIKPDQNSKPVSVSARMLILHKRLVVYSFSAPYSRFADLKHARDSFFNSFAVSSLSPHSASAIATDSIAMSPTPTPVFDSVKARLDPTTRPALVRSNTLRFIVSFAACILLLAAVLYLLVKWKKRNTPNS